MQPKITVSTTINASIEKVWDCWTKPEHITKWAFASDTWEAPYAENDVRLGGKFLTRMSAKDGSASFDFNGVYTEVVPLEKMVYTIEGGRQVEVLFKQEGNECIVTEIFDPENENPLELQQSGWQAILESFKKHVEEK